MHTTVWLEVKFALQLWTWMTWNYVARRVVWGRALPCLFDGHSRRAGKTVLRLALSSIAAAFSIMDIYDFFLFWPMLVEATAEYWFASLVQWCFHNAHQIISSSLLYLLARLLRQLTNLYHHWTFSRFLSNLREHGSTLFTGEDVDARHSTSPTGMYCGADGLPRTTNSFEGWRREFEQKMNTSHASRDCANSSRPGSWRLGLCRREWSSEGPSASIG